MDHSNSIANLEYLREKLCQRFVTQPFFHSSRADLDVFILQWAAIALVGVLIDNSVVQLLAFCGIHLAMFAILVCFKPFANR